MSYGGLLDKLVTIKRGTVVRGAGAEEVRDFAVIATAVPASIQMKSSTGVQADAGWTPKGLWMAYFLPNQDVRERDRIVDSLGTFEVVSDPPENIRGRVTQVLLRRMAIVGA